MQDGRGIRGEEVREEAGMWVKTKGDAACKAVQGRRNGVMGARGVIPRTVDLPEESGAVGIDAGTPSRSGRAVCAKGALDSPMPFGRHLKQRPCQKRRAISA